MEGSPQVIKEAMAANCPVVTTDVGDVRNILKDSELCYVCKPDSKEIAERINKIVDKPARSNGRAKIGEYDNIRITEQILNIYMRFGKAKMFQRCTQGIWDTSIPGIRFDEQGVSNYCRIHENLMIEFARGSQGDKRWSDIVNRIIIQGKGRKYDCIIGVSGGTDSSFLMHKAVKRGLRPLAVNLDNGWSSDIALKNIRKVTSALNIDLETYVIDYEEVQDVLRSQMKAGMPWIDAPTDYAIMSVLYRIAQREKVRYILTGADFRSEGKQPTEWTYTDRRQIRHIHNKFGTIRLKSFPLISLFELVYLGYIRKIKTVSPFNYIDYQKKTAQKLLMEKYGWEYYGGHHHENLFTKFAITYWLPEKFNIDKRLITLSAQVVSGEITRHEALAQIEKPAWDAGTIEKDKSYVIKKLGFSSEEYNEIWSKPGKSFTDYPSNYPFIYKFAKIIIPLIGKILPQKPKIFFEMEGRA
jgi:N-acetyl sugar amidotransferase